MTTITIQCPTCHQDLELETEADQTCDVHDWHAQTGDTTLCEDCGYEWVCKLPRVLEPSNRSTTYDDGCVDTANDVLLCVRTNL